LVTIDIVIAWIPRIRNAAVEEKAAGNVSRNGPTEINVIVSSTSAGLGAGIISGSPVCVAAVHPAFNVFTAVSIIDKDMAVAVSVRTDWITAVDGTDEVVVVREVVIPCSPGGRVIKDFGRLVACLDAINPGIPLPYVSRRSRNPGNDTHNHRHAKRNVSHLSSPLVWSFAQSIPH
jgi:hypothetical protein